jgi:hypothetical protein
VVWPSHHLDAQNNYDLDKINVHDNFLMLDNFEFNLKLDALGLLQSCSNLYQYLLGVSIHSFKFL